MICISINLLKRGGRENQGFPKIVKYAKVLKLEL